MTITLDPHVPAGSGYAIDHIAAAQRCCELHNINCEPGELCCDECSEDQHYTQHNPTAINPRHIPISCVLTPCACRTEQQHLDLTQPGYAGGRLGMREPR